MYVLNVTDYENITDILNDFDNITSSNYTD